MKAYEILNSRHASDIKIPAVSYSFENSKLCLLNQETTAGPYYLPKAPMRIDIREQQAGVTLMLGFKVVNAADCKAIPGTVVDLWQCNAFGKYSGFHSDTESRYLRGRQISDKLGFSEFTTIFPGWETNRAPHLCLKVWMNGTEKLTTQLFFPQDVVDYIARQPPYHTRTDAPVKNENDPILYAFHGVKGGWPKVTGFGKKLIATLTIGIAV